MSLVDNFIVAWWRRNFWSDVLVGIVVAVALAMLVDSADDPATAYQVAGGLGVSLMAFVVAPVATVVGLRSGRRFRAFGDAQTGRLLSTMKWTFVVGMALLATTLLGALLDTRQDSTAWLRWAALAGGLAAMLASARLVWFFTTFLRVAQASNDN